LLAPLLALPAAAPVLPADVDGGGTLLLPPADEAGVAVAAEAGSKGGIVPEAAPAPVPAAARAASRSASRVVGSASSLAAAAAADTALMSASPSSAKSAWRRALTLPLPLLGAAAGALA